MYEFKDEYVTGIEMIDNEHRRLFEIADEVYNIYHDEFIVDKYDHVKEVLEQLKSYTVSHFEHEEAYMEKVGYKRLFTQKVQHEEFRNKLDEMDFELLDANPDKTIGEILDFLTDWLVNHILYNDKKIGEK